MTCNRAVPNPNVVPLATNLEDGQLLGKGAGRARGDCILGFAMIGAEAGEVAAVVETVMLAGMPYTGSPDAIITHPTMAEGLVSLFSSGPIGPGRGSCSLATRSGLLLP
jgi:hypothetical protein